MPKVIDSEYILHCLFPGWLFFFHRWTSAKRLSIILLRHICLLSEFNTRHLIPHLLYPGGLCLPNSLCCVSYKSYAIHHILLSSPFQRYAIRSWIFLKWDDVYTCQRLDIRFIHFWCDRFKLYNLESTYPFIFIPLIVYNYLCICRFQRVEAFFSSPSE